MNSPTWLRPPKGVHWTPRLAATLTLIVIASALAFKGVVSLLFALLTFGGDIDPAINQTQTFVDYIRYYSVDGVGKVTKK